MPRIYHVFLLIIGYLILTVYPAATADTPSGEWELVMDKDGIKSYSRRVTGSGILEFRSVMVADVAPEVVGEVLRDTAAQPEWLPFCKEAYVLDKKDLNNFTVYMSFDIPWPVKDRDLVMEASTAYDYDHGRAVSDLKRIELASCPPNDAHIRMPDMKGQFVFEFVTRQRTGIIHTYRVDLGGSLPEWMANFANKNNMYNTCINMQKMFKKAKYIELGKASQDRKVIESILADKPRVKRILEARLREFIHDSDFVDLLMRETRNVDEVLDAENGRISESLLYGWGSDESKKKAVRVVLELCLSGLKLDEKLAKTILNDDALANTILRGPKPGEKTSRQIIEAYLKTQASLP